MKADLNEEPERENSECYTFSVTWIKVSIQPQKPIHVKMNNSLIYLFVIFLFNKLPLQIKYTCFYAELFFIVSDKCQILPPSDSLVYRMH